MTNGRDDEWQTDCKHERQGYDSLMRPGCLDCGKSDKEIRASRPRPPEPTLADFEELCAIHLGTPDAPAELPKGWRYVTDRCAAKDGSEAGRLLTVLDEKGATVGDIFYADFQDPHEVGRDLSEVVCATIATIYTRRSHSGPGRGRRR